MYSNKMSLLFILMLISLFSFRCSSNPSGESPLPELPPLSPDLPPADVDRVCIIGDAGTGGNDQTMVTYFLNSEGCQHILYVGDVIYEKGLLSVDDPQFNTKFYSPYKKLIEEQNAIFYMSMGNHDWGNSANPIPIWKMLAEKYQPNIVYDNFYYVQKINNLCLMQIETSNRSLFNEQKEWFTQFKNDPWWNSCKFTIAFGHHPYWSAGQHGDADATVKEFLDHLVVGHFDLYACGHDHQQSDESQLKATKFFVSGSAGKVREMAKAPRGGWGAAKRGYLVLDIKENIADFKFVTIDNYIKTAPHKGQIRGNGFRP